MGNKHELISNEIVTHKLCFIGETHGVQQNIDIIDNIFTKYNFESLALEWFDVLKEELQNYLLSGDVNPIVNKYGFKLLLEDGRASIEHLRLIKKYFDSGQLKNVILYGDSDTYIDWNTRDKNYFTNFVKQYKSEFKTLIIAGGLHSKITPTKHIIEKGILYPMGYHLKNKFGYFPNAKIKYLSGEYRNIGIKKFKTVKHPQVLNNEYLNLIVEKATPL